MESTTLENDRRREIESLQGFLGLESGPFVEKIEAGAVRKFVNAIEYENPSSPENYCVPERLGEVVVPPTFLTTVTSAREIDKKVNLSFAIGALHAEQEYEFVRPLRVGDTVVARSRIVAIDEKVGRRSGLLIFITSQTVFEDTQGNVIARCTRKRVLREK